MNCSESSRMIIAQIKGVLEQLTDADYSKPLDVFNGSTLGQHFRHILDFYNCVVKASKEGRLDYCYRDRDKGIEEFTNHALKGFQTLANELKSLEDDMPLEIVTDFHVDNEVERAKVKSSVGRELMYAYDHAVHHLAIIKIGIKTNCPYVVIDRNIGVAPSTIKYQSSVHS